METSIILQAVKEELEKAEALIKTLKITIESKNKRIGQLENRRPITAI
ncbi:hypothetical protein KA005_07460 [bacterium]|nr:hypothetical protein [bacterium]